jgi:hypothetical protein
MKARVCVIDDGRPGHVNQTLGVLRMLDMPDLAQTTVRVAVRRKVLKRPLLLALAAFGRLPRRLLSLAYRAYYGERPPALPAGTLLLSTGGDTLIANLVLARLHGLNNVFIGKRYAAATRHASLLVTAGGAAVPQKIITLPFAPVYPDVAASTAVVREPGARYAAVLVGGDSQEYRYTAADYRALAEALNTLRARQRLRLLVTTSRRTGAEGEAILRADLDRGHLAAATWYGEAPQPTAAAYCQASDLIVVTEDSGTMLTEALNFGKPLVAVRPAQVSLPRFYADFLARLVDQGLHRCAIGDLAGLDPGTLSPARPVDHRELVACVRRLLTPMPPASRPMPPDFGQKA